MNGQSVVIDGVHFAQPVRIDEDVAFISLSQNREAVVCVEDLPLLAGYRMLYQYWHGTVHYCVAKPPGKKPSILLHRLLLTPPKDIQVDHIDGDGLNNRRSNLRLATAAQNSWNTGLKRTNTSGHKGVSWRADRGKWQVHIRVNGERLSLGHYEELQDAADAYVAAAREHHGEFAQVDRRRNQNQEAEHG